MPRFTYIAKDNSGKKITGFDDAVTRDEVIARLQTRNLVVINVKVDSRKQGVKFKSRPSKFGHARGHSRVTTNDLTLFCRQLATLLGSGVSILEALSIISKQVSSRQFFNVLSDLKKRMEEGLSLHEAMAKNGKVFSGMWVNLVESGEASGNLSIILARLASYLERNAQFRGKILSALMYPIILMAVGIGALVFLTVKIIPTFAELFASFNMDLPLLTQILISVSNFVRGYLIFLILGMVGIVFLIKRYIRTPDGRKKFEHLLFSFPLFGEFFRNLIIERFSSEMSTLIESGVPILYALEISERSVNNLVMADIIREIREEVREGRPLSIQMENSGFFEPMVAQMVRIGEEVGDLAGMFKKINSFYLEYVDTFLTRFTSMFEPIMLVFIGGIIGIMVVGMFLPIFQISQIGMK